MTFSLAIQNEYSENIVDQNEGFTLYHKSSGTCVLPSAVPLAGFRDNSFRTKYIYPSDLRNVDSNGVVFHSFSTFDQANWLYNEKINFASPSFQQIRISFSNGSIDTYWPNPVSTNEDDLIFFRMPPEGIMALAQTWIPFTGADPLGRTLNNGLFAWCAPFYTHPGFALSYRVVSPDVQLPSAETHGVIMYNENGLVTFDTRRPIASFSDHIQLTAAQVQNIIAGGASITVNLRRPVGNAWIAAEGSGGVSYRYVIQQGQRPVLDTLRIRQLSTTQILIERGQTLAPSTTVIQSFTTQSYDDALFIIGDFD